MSLVIQKAGVIFAMCVSQVNNALMGNLVAHVFRYAGSCSWTGLYKPVFTRPRPVVWQKFVKQVESHSVVTMPMGRIQREIKAYEREVICGHRQAV